MCTCRILILATLAGLSIFATPKARADHAELVEFKRLADGGRDICPIGRSRFALVREIGGGHSAVFVGDDGQPKGTKVVEGGTLLCHPGASAALVGLLEGRSPTQSDMLSIRRLDLAGQVPKVGKIVWKDAPDRVNFAGRFFGASADLTRIVVGHQVDRSKPSLPTVIQIPDGRVVAMGTTPHELNNFGLARDGSVLVYGAADGVHLLDVQQGKDRVVATTASLGVQADQLGVHLAPDKAYIAAWGGITRKWWIIDLKSSHVTALRSGLVGIPQGASWHPDGRWVFLYGDRGAFFDVKSGQISKVPGCSRVEDAAFSSDGVRVYVLKRDADDTSGLWVGKFRLGTP